jgi:hypothetical protein
MKRCELRLTDEEHEQLKKVAKKHNKPMSKLMRIYLRIGLAMEKDGTDLIIREREKNTRIIIV